MNKQPKISTLTKVALGLTAVGAVSILTLRYAEGLALLGLFVFMPLAFVLSIFSLVQIKRNRGQLKGIYLVVPAIIIQIAVAGPFGYSVTSEKILSRILCRCNWTALREAMLAYANDNDGKYPAPERWCDILVENTETPDKLFCKRTFREAGMYECHYVLNPDCQLNSPNNVVLLFENKGGWNQFGGLELLTDESNYRKGWRVLFNDGHLEFIQPFKLKKLNWADK